MKTTPTVARNDDDTATINADLLAVAKDFVALYAGLDDAIGPSVKAKVVRARAVIAKADAHEEKTR